MEGPGAVSGKGVRKRGSLIDLFPTVLDLLGCALPRPVDGISFRRLVERRGGRGWPRRNRVAYMESDVSRFKENPRFHIRGDAGRWLALRARKFKLIVIPHPEGREYELYNLRRDPGEARNLAARRPRRVRKLERKLDAWLAAHPLATKGRTAEPTESLDPELEERLRELGYIN